MRTILQSVAVISIALLLSCDRENRKPVARSFDRFLYPEDLVGVVPEGVGGNDSVQLVHAYIEQWLRQQALLHHAQRNVTINTERLEAQVEEYKNGLIVYEFEQALISQKLDTLVSDREIVDYYNGREELFILKQPVLKVSYIKLPHDAPELDRVKRLFLSTNFEEKDLLEKYCARYATDYSLHDTTWQYADELMKNLPLSRIGEENYGRTGRIFEIIENNELYLIILHDSKFRDARSPLALVRDNIRHLILNKRKIDLVDQMQKSILADAREKNNIEIYN